MQAPVIHRKALEKDETLPIEQLIPHSPKERAKHREGKQFPRDSGQWRVGGDEVVGGMAKLGNLLVAEDVRPALRMIAVILGFPDR